MLPLLRIVLATSPAALDATLIDSEVLGSLVLTLYTGTMATLLAILTGVPLAYILAHYDFSGKRMVEGVIHLPVAIPHTAAGVALLMVFGRQAQLGRLGAAAHASSSQVVLQASL